MIYTAKERCDEYKLDSATLFQSVNYVYICAELISFFFSLPSFFSVNQLTFLLATGDLEVINQKREHSHSSRINFSQYYLLHKIIYEKKKINFILLHCIIKKRPHKDNVRERGENKTDIRIYVLYIMYFIEARKGGRVFKTP